MSFLKQAGMLAGTGRRQGAEGQMQLSWTHTGHTREMHRDMRYSSRYFVSDWKVHDMNMQKGLAARRHHRADYADVLDAPTHMVAEVLAETLYTQPRPAMPHGFASSGIGAKIRDLGSTICNAR